MKLSIVAIGTGALLFGVDNPGVIQREWNKILKSTLRHLVYFWWEKIMPRHFHGHARGLYPGVFFVRKRSTQRRKFRRFGHSEPLLNYPIGKPPANKDTLEGHLALFPSVSGTAKQATGTWRAPRVTQVYKDEATAVNEDDKRIMARLANQILVGKLGNEEVQWVKRGPKAVDPDRTMRRIARLKIV